MNPLQSPDQIVTPVKEKRMHRKIAATYAQDENTLGALTRTVKERFLTALMLGDKEKIREKAKPESTDTFILQTCLMA